MSGIEKKSRISARRMALFLAFLILSVCWILVIFDFSSTDGKTSSSQSKAITEKVVQVIDHSYQMPEVIEPKSVDKLYDNLTRKAAHVGMYAVLGCLIFCAVKSLYVTKKSFIVSRLSVPLCILIAIGDEYNQTLTEGRQGRVLDVFIDTAGIVIGTAFCVFLLKFLNKRKLKKQL